MRCREENCDSRDDCKRCEDYQTKPKLRTFYDFQRGNAV